MGCTPLIPDPGGRGRWITEFEVSLVSRGSSRTARTTEKPYHSPPPKLRKNKGLVSDGSAGKGISHQV